MKIIFLHGYSGAPENFTNLPEIIKKECKCKIYNLPLPGHTSYKDLFPLTYQDFYDYTKSLLDEDVIIIGYSIGSIIALDLARTHKQIKGIISISTPLALKFPFSIPFPKTKLLFPKDSSDFEVHMRKNEKYMRSVPLNGLRIIKEGGKRLQVDKIKQPILFIELEKDLLVHVHNRDLLKSPQGSQIILKAKSKHNPLYPKVPKQLEKNILKFLQDVIKDRGRK